MTTKIHPVYESLFSLYTFLYNENVYRHYIRKCIMKINFHVLQKYLLLLYTLLMKW